MASASDYRKLKKQADTVRRAWKSERSRRVRGSVALRVYDELAAKFIDSMEDALVPFFRDCVASASTAIAEATVTKAAQSGFIGTVFEPAAWNRALVDAALPHLVGLAGRAAVAQFLHMGVDPRKDKFVEKLGLKSETGSEWLEDNSDPIGLPSTVFITAAGVVRMAWLAQWPVWVRRVVANVIKETFDQPYWKSINSTTQVDIGRVIERGLAAGRSMAQIAEDIKSSTGLGFEYYRNRARGIARTEAGNAMNGARRASLDYVRENIPQLDIHPVWISVLGSTTRDTHAALHDVPADRDGLWSLSGHRVPWPGHYSLPARERVNCQCTIVNEYGMDEEEAKELLQDYFNRTNGKEGKWYEELCCRLHDGDWE